MTFAISDMIRDALGVIRMDGQQMEPTISAGDMVYLSRPPFTEALRGRIVAFALGDDPEAALPVIGRLQPDRGGLYMLCQDNPAYSPVFNLPADKYLGECVGLVRSFTPAPEMEQTEATEQAG